MLKCTAAISVNLVDDLFDRHQWTGACIAFCRASIRTDPSALLNGFSYSVNRAENPWCLLIRV